MQGSEENKVSWATCSASFVHVFLQAQCSALFISSYQALGPKDQVHWLPKLSIYHWHRHP